MDSLKRDLQERQGLAMTLLAAILTLSLHFLICEVREFDTMVLTISSLSNWLPHHFLHARDSVKARE